MNLSDIDLAAARNSNQPLAYESEFCIRGKIGALYKVTTSSNLRDSNGFALAGDAGDAINYQLIFKNNLIDGTEEVLQPDTISQIYTITASTSSCNTGNGASITVVFDNEDVNNAISEQYTGTIFVAIEMV